MNERMALIIDDNLLNIEILALLLEQQGIASTAVERSQYVREAVAALARVDLVFLDINMPYLTGYQLLRLLKDDPRLIRVPVVAYTVHLNEQERARAAGFDGFLGKPLSVQRFPDQLRRILQGDSVWEV
ncbi:MAG TPA: response regulator [Aggregatilineales bacterium]|jgi:two-component system cell cycle response regulator DivK|nr:response regulator [Aggregatilineales bacterium]